MGAKHFNLEGVMAYEFAAIATKSDEIQGRHIFNKLNSVIVEFPVIIKIKDLPTIGALLSLKRPAGIFMVIKLDPRAKAIYFQEIDCPKKINCAGECLRQSCPHKNCPAAKY